jgi:hypothetical protein
MKTKNYDKTQGQQKRNGRSDFMYSFFTSNEKPVDMYTPRNYSNKIHVRKSTVEKGAKYEMK